MFYLSRHCMCCHLRAALKGSICIWRWGTSVFLSVISIFIMIVTFTFTFILWSSPSHQFSDHHLRFQVLFSYVADTITLTSCSSHFLSPSHTLRDRYFQFHLHDFLHETCFAMTWCREGDRGVGGVNLQVQNIIKFYGKYRSPNWLFFPVQS